MTFQGFPLEFLCHLEQDHDNDDWMCAPQKLWSCHVGNVASYTA